MFSYHKNMGQFITKNKTFPTESWILLSQVSLHILGAGSHNQRFARRILFPFPIIYVPNENVIYWNIFLMQRILYNRVTSDNDLHGG